MSAMEVKVARAGAVAAGLVVAAYTAVAMTVRPSMFSDSGWGFLVWDAMRRGAPFNHGVAPDPADISRDIAGFLTTWSPGQYVLPGLIEMLGASLGAGIVVTVALASALGLIGWHRLYVAFGFPPLTVAIAVAIVAGSRFFALPFGIYTGGEALLFAVAPWVVLGVWKLGELRWRHLPLLVVGLGALAFAKLSGVVIGVAMLAGAVLWPGQPWLGSSTLRRAAIAAVAAAVFGVLLHAVWLSRGWTAASAGAEWSWQGLPAQLALAANAVWSSSLSLGELTAYLFLHPSRPLLDSLDLVNFALAPVAVATLILVWRRLPPEYARYRLLLTTVAVVYVAILACISVRGGAVSPEERHFRPVSLVLLVGMVHVLANLPGRWIRGALAGCAALMALYGVASFTSHALANVGKPLDQRGFRHAIADHAALAFLGSIDRPAADGSRPMVLVTSPEIGLVLRHARVMSNHADFESEDTLHRRVYRGRTARLYVLIQSRLVDSGKAEIVLRSFKDYPLDSWRKLPLGAFTAFAQEE